MRSWPATTLSRRLLIEVMLASGGMLASGAAFGMPLPVAYDVREFGVRGDGRTLDHAAINRAIATCSAAGGGTVVIPAGRYLCGTIRLLSRVHLWLAPGAVILGSKRIDDYASTASPVGATNGGHLAQDKRDNSDRHLFVAASAVDVSIAGFGTIDGQGSAFWKFTDRQPAPEENRWREVSTHDWKPDSPRPSPMLEFYDCSDVRLAGITLANSSGWTLRLNNCRRARVEGVTIRNPNGPNTDGIDIVASENVFISRCDIRTGDDAICLKSQSLDGGPIRPTRNIIVSDCLISTNCNAFKIGTASFGHVSDISFSDNVIHGEERDYRRRGISGVAIEMVDGGFLENVRVSNIEMRNVRAALFVRRGNRNPVRPGALAGLQGVTITNVRATGTILASSVTGVPGLPVEDITLAGIDLSNERPDAGDIGIGEVPLVAGDYPEALMFGPLPTYGLFCRDFRGLTIRDMVLRCKPSDIRPPLVCVESARLTIDTLRANGAAREGAVALLHDVRDVELVGCTPGQRFEGAEIKNIAAQEGCRAEARA